MMGNGWKKIAKSSPTCQKWHSHTKKKERKEERKEERTMDGVSKKGAAMWSERNNKNGTNVWYEVKQMIVYGRNMKH
jgi:hypothetical protein